MTSSLLAAFLAVAPVFGLILAGIFAGRAGILGQNASDVLSRFVVWLSLPAMLFDTVASARWADLWQPGFIVAFGASGLAMMAVATAFSVFKRRQTLADAALEGLNAGYPNVGFMGFPIAVTVMGPPALLPTTIALVLTMCVFFACAIILIEIGAHAGGHMGQALLKVAKSLIRHPLILSPICGIPFAWLGLTMPAPVDHFLRTLGSAASPCALVAIGLFLSQGHPKAKSVPSEDSKPKARRGEPFLSNSSSNRAPSETRRDVTTPLLTMLKLVIQPLLTWLLAYKLFPIGPIAAKTAVIMASLPTGTGAFMLADYYKRDARVSTQVIVLSTVLSLVSVSLTIAALP